MALAFARLLDGLKGIADFRFPWFIDAQSGEEDSGEGPTAIVRLKGFQGKDTLPVVVRLKQDPPEYQFVLSDPMLRVAKNSMAATSVLRLNAGPAPVATALAPEGRILHHVRVPLGSGGDDAYVQPELLASILFWLLKRTSLYRLSYGLNSSKLPPPAVERILAMFKSNMQELDAASPVEKLARQCEFSSQFPEELLQSVLAIRPLEALGEPQIQPKTRYVELPIRHAELEGCSIFLHSIPELPSFVRICVSPLAAESVVTGPRAVDYMVTGMSFTSHGAPFLLAEAPAAIYRYDLLLRPAKPLAVDPEVLDRVVHDLLLSTYALDMIAYRESLETVGVLDESQVDQLYKERLHFYKDLLGEERAES